MLKHMQEIQKVQLEHAKESPNIGLSLFPMVVPYITRLENTIWIPILFLELGILMFPFLQKKLQMD